MKRQLLYSVECANTVSSIVDLLRGGLKRFLTSPNSVHTEISYR